METTPTPSRSKLWPCITLALLTAALALTSLWLALAPPSREIPSQHIAGTPGAIATCIAEKLSGGDQDAHERGIRHAKVSTLTRDGEPTTRLIIDGAIKVHVVITLSADGTGHTEARLTPVPRINPVPELALVINACAQKN